MALLAMNKNISLIGILCFCVASSMFAQNKPVVHDTLDGWLTIGVPMQQVFEKLGEPDSVGDFETWGMTGLNYRFYQYSRWGLSLYSEQDNDSEVVFDIIAQGDSPFHTSRGVSIGDDKKSVIRKYEDCLSDEFTMDSSDLSIINSIYEGTFFFYEEGKVVKIEIGALAE